MQSGAAVARRSSSVRYIIVRGMYRTRRCVRSAASHRKRTWPERWSKCVSKSHPRRGWWDVIEADAVGWETSVDLLAFLRSAMETRGRCALRRLSNCLGSGRFHHDARGPSRTCSISRAMRAVATKGIYPAQARAFMQEARHVQFENARPPHSPLARAYFREREPTPGAHGDALGCPSGLLSESQPNDSVHIAPGAMAAVVEVLREAGVLTDEPRGLLRSAEGGPSPALSRDVCRHAREYRGTGVSRNVDRVRVLDPGPPFAPQKRRTRRGDRNLGLESGRLGTVVSLSPPFQGAYVLHATFDVCPRSADCGDSLAPVRTTATFRSPAGCAVNWCGAFRRHARRAACLEVLSSAAPWGRMVALTD